MCMHLKEVRETAVEIPRDRANMAETAYKPLER